MRATIVMKVLALTGIFAFTSIVNSPSPLYEAPDRPPAGVNAASAPLAPTPADYVSRLLHPEEEIVPTPFLREQRNGDPVRWDPCRPIEYVINPDGGPANGTEIINRAMKQVSQSSGYKFVYVGTTEERVGQYRPRQYLPSLYGERWSPVLIAWDREMTTDDGNTIVGYALTEHTNRPRGGKAYVTGSILLDAADFEKWDETFTPARAQSIQNATVIHEAGHILGLGHSEHFGDLMYEAVYPNPYRYQPNDLAALAALADGGCMPDL